MTTKDEIKNRISMALKDPILQQGFEIICKENAKLEKACDETQELLDKQIEATYKLAKENAELKERADRPSLKAFKNYMCNKYKVKNVDYIDMPIKEYADLMEVFEAGYAAKEKEIIDRLFEKKEENYV